MDLRALTLTKRFFRKFSCIDRVYFVELFRVEFRCDARNAHDLVDDLIDGGYLTEREVDDRRVISPGPNLDSGVLAMVGVRVPQV